MAIPCKIIVFKNSDEAQEQQTTQTCAKLCILTECKYNLKPRRTVTPYTVNIQLTNRPSYVQCALQYSAQLSEDADATRQCIVLYKITFCIFTVCDCSDF